jgi:hypothetical protein
MKVEQGHTWRWCTTLSSRATVREEWMQIYTPYIHKIIVVVDF